jgi:FkbM family methyltransferase
MRKVAPEPAADLPVWCLMKAGQIDGRVVEFIHAQQTVRFFVQNPDDVIQRHHNAGSFYELEELAIITRYFAAGSSFVDIGSNVGNHAVYVEKYLAPDRVHVIEPNPAACAILRLNLLLNGCARVDTRLLGIGLSDAPGLFSLAQPMNNLGGTRLVPTEGGGTAALPGDVLLREVRAEFVKIDVEAMEIRVLRGIEEFIRRNRPTLFVEVNGENATAFNDWASTNRYVLVERFRRYPTNENFLMKPAETLP